MAAKETIDIDIKSKADTAGFDQAEKARKALEADLARDAAVESRRYEAAKAQLLTAKEAETQRVEKLIEASKRATEARAAEAAKHKALLEASEQAEREYQETVKSAYASINETVTTGASQAVESARQQTQANEELVTSLFGLQTAEEAARRATDVEEAKTRLAARTVEEKANAVKNLGGFVTQAGFQITDFAVQVDGGTSAITAFSQQFPQLLGAVTQSGLDISTLGEDILGMAIDGGTALTIIGTAVGIGAKLAIDAYDAMEEAQDNLTAAQKRGAEQIIFQRQQQQLLSDQVREEFILGYYQKQTAELGKQVALLGRINELRAAQSSTAEAQAAAAITLAQNTGGNVGAAQANALAVGTDSRLDAIAGEVANAEAVAAQAAEKLAAANTLLAEFTRRGDQYGDAFIAADQAFQDATAANESARLDLQNQRAIAAEKLSQIEANNTAALSDLTKGATDAQTKAAKETLDALVAKAEEVKAAQIAAAEAKLGDLKKQAELFPDIGTEQKAAAVAAQEKVIAEIKAKSAESAEFLSSNAKQAINDLTRALADGIVKPDEMALIIDTINQIKVSREGTDREILAGMVALQMSATNTQLLIGLVAELRSTVEEQRGAILSLSNK